MQIILITSVFSRKQKASLLPGIRTCWECEREDIVSLSKSRRVNGLEKCCGTVYQFLVAHERTSQLPSLWNDKHCLRTVMAAMKSINYSDTRKKNEAECGPLACVVTNKGRGQLQCRNGRRGLEEGPNGRALLQSTWEEMTFYLMENGQGKFKDTTTSNCFVTRCFCFKQPPKTTGYRR